MKILIVTPIFPPETRGPATYTFELSRRLPATVITFTQNANAICIPTSGGPVVRQLRLLSAVLREGRKNDVIYAQGADVVGLAACIAGKILGKPVVIKFVGDLSIETQRDFHKKISYLPLITRISLQLADKIIFPADHLRQTVIKKYKIKSGKTEVIYNAT